MSSASPDLRSGRDGELGRNGRRTGSFALHLYSELELAASYPLSLMTILEVGGMWVPGCWRLGHNVARTPVAMK